MNHVERNRIHNLMYQYHIKDTEENFNKIEEVIAERKFYIYRKILYIIDNCCIVEKDSTRITFEICLNNNRELLKDLTNSFLRKKISRRKVKEKIGHVVILLGIHF